MGRIGVRNRAEAEAVLKALSRAPRVELRGLYTHFAAADEEDEGYTRLQAKRFEDIRAMMPPGITVHASASAALCRFPDLRFDMVRAGIVMYGCQPWEGCGLNLKQVMRWKSEVCCVRDLSPGESVGYGRTFTAPKAMKAAVVCVGYGDCRPLRVCRPGMRPC